MPDESETALVSAARDGDIESFGELCRRYYASMVGVAYTVLRDHHLAEDAAQESFARALVQITQLKSDARFGAWLAAICRNVARDMLAIKARRLSSDRIDSAAEPPDADETVRAVRRAVEQLPDSVREVLVLRYYSGLSYQQIGSVLGLSHMTVNGRLTRAKRKLLRILRRNGLPENLL